MVSWLSVCEAKKNRRIVKVLMSTSFIAGLSLSLAPVADAQSLSQLFQGETMTSDWGGTRTKLANDGFTFQLGYVNQFADDFAGGVRQGGDFAQQFNADVLVNLGKIASIQGGIIDIGFSQRWGRSTSADFIGNRIVAQAIYGAGENLHVTNLAYTQAFYHNFIKTEVGDFALGNLYGNDIFFCHFESNAFCGHSTVLPNDTNGWSDYPIARWGGNIKIEPTKGSYIEVGVFESNPLNGTYPDGTKISLEGSTGVVIPTELSVSTAFFGLPGHYTVGAYYDTSSIADVVNSKTTDNGRYGGYFIFDQMILSFSPGNHRGLYVFGSYTRSDNRTTSVPQQIVGGFDIEGPFAARPLDFVDIGISNVSVNHRLLSKQLAVLAHDDITDFALESGQSAIEGGYGFRPMHWLLLHPNIQYIDNPQAFSYKHTPCAWVFGFDLRVIL